jgi:hypothetical protein
LLRVLEKPENTFSTSLFAFSFSNRPSFVNKPTSPAEHLNRSMPVRLGQLKRLNCVWEGGFEITEKRENEAEVVVVVAAISAASL